MSSNMSLEKLLPKLIESFNNQTADYQSFVRLTTKLEEMTDLKQTIGDDAMEWTDEESTNHGRLQEEIVILVMPLIQKLCDLDLLIGVKFGQRSASMDSLGEPCVNGGVQLSIMDKVCDHCGKQYGHPRTHLCEQIIEDQHTSQD